MPEPHTHYFEVTMEITDQRDNTLTVVLPSWTPGSYLLREFSKSLEEFEVTDQNGRALPFTQTTKSEWQITRNRASTVRISYRIYAYELTVRTSFLNADHGYFNGTNLFLYLDGHLDLPAEVTIEPYKDWSRVSTGLKAVPGKPFTFSAPDYDVLVDAPFEIGNHTEFTFEAAGITHRVAMYGWANYDEASLKKQMAQVVEACTDVFGGENPNDDYLFIVHNLSRGGGGLEHLNSTTLQTSRFAYSPSQVNGFLNLTAHEYFHLWNVKRIRPQALGPFDYTQENYTYHLWVMEGFTSYYAGVALQRASITTEDDFINATFNLINSVEGRPGSRVQPVAMASFDTWIKQYRPNENSYNTTISYYGKGQVLAGLLDLIILHHTQGEKSLDDVMQYLWEFYKKEDRGFTDEELLEAFETVAGIEMDDWFEQHVFGTERPDYETIFGYAGILITDELAGNTTPYWGGSLSSEGGIVKVNNLYRGATAYDGGINVNDEILAVNGFRVRSKNDIDRYMEMTGVGDTIEITVSRDDIVQTLSMVVKPINRPRLTPRLDPRMTSAQRNVLDTWLRKMGE